jgi:hypothetical protein
VPCRTPYSLFETYGVPHYLKVDIEGSDRCVIDALALAGRAPALPVDRALHCVDIDAVHALGYTRFAVVDQSKLPAVGNPSGPFGDAIAGPWVDAAEAHRLYADGRANRSPGSTSTPNDDAALSIITACYNHGEYLTECIGTERDAQSPQTDAATSSSSSRHRRRDRPLVPRRAARRARRPTRARNRPDPAQPRNRGLAFSQNFGIARRARRGCSRSTPTTHRADLRRGDSAGAAADPRRNVIFSPCQHFGARRTSTLPDRSTRPDDRRLHDPRARRVPARDWESVGGYDETMRRPRTGISTSARSSRSGSCRISCRRRAGTTGCTTARGRAPRGWRSSPTSRPTGAATRARWPREPQRPIGSAYELARRRERCAATRRCLRKRVRCPLETLLGHL